MVIENVVFMAIGWLSVATVLFMFLILNINRVEIRNSQRALKMKLAMHYNHRFHRMRVAFEKYHVFKYDHPQTVDEMIVLFDTNIRLLHESVQILSDEITLNCVNNQFLFIQTPTLRFTLTLQCKEIIDIYQEWVNLLRTFEDHVQEHRKLDTSEVTVKVVETWETINLRYNMLIEHVIDVYALLSNETYVDILNIKKGL